MAEENSKGKRKRKFEKFMDALNMDEEERKRLPKSLQDRVKSCKEHVTTHYPEPTDEDRINSAKSTLRRRIGAGEERQQSPIVLFFVELAPYSSSRGAVCRFPTCNEHIEERSYRMAVHPGMYNVYKSPDFYHVRCFENLVDFSQAAYLDRIQPVTRNTARLRELKSTSIADGNHFVDGGAERLVLEWKVSMGKLIDRRDGVPDEPIDPDMNDLLRKSGSASYKPKIMSDMSKYEFLNLSMNLAPIESNGIEDQDEWNLFEQYLAMTFDDVEDLGEPHSLSDMLEDWKADCFLACADEDELTDIGKEEKEKLGEKAIRAIKRLSSIVMPAFESAFFGRQT